MPNRVLKDSITCSRQIDSLTWFQEVMFYRLIVKADDFGRYYADAQIIKSTLFPKKKDLTEKTVADGLEALESEGLINRYEWDGETYLQIVKWANHQQRRAKQSKFPDSKGNHSLSNDGKCDQVVSDDIKCNQMISNDINCNQMSPNTNTNTKSKTKTIGEPIPPLADDETLISIQKNHDVLFDAAKKAGLPMTEGNMDSIVGLYGEYGLDAVLHGIREASDHNKVSVAYIRAVARNYGNDKPEEDDWETELAKHLLV